MKLKPLQDWAVIEKDETDERTAGGIIIPDSAKDKPTRGVVLAIGPGKFKTEENTKEKKFIPTSLKPGQRIIYGKYSAREFEVDNAMFTLVREEDVLGIFEENPVSEKKASPVKKAVKKTEPVQKGSEKTGKKKEPAAKSKK